MAKENGFNKAFANLRLVAAIFAMLGTLVGTIFGAGGAYTLLQSAIARNLEKIEEVEQVNDEQDVELKELRVKIADIAVIQTDINWLRQYLEIPKRGVDKIRTR